MFHDFKHIYYIIVKFQSVRQFCRIKQTKILKKENFPSISSLKLALEVSVKKKDFLGFKFAFTIDKHS